MGKETRKETDFFGNEKKVHYEDGEKIGETRVESGIFGDKEVTRDTNGNKLSETRTENGFFGDKEVTRDTNGNKLSETKTESNPFDIHGLGTKRVIYEDGEKIGEIITERGCFEIKTRLYDSPGKDVDLTTRTDRKKQESPIDYSSQSSGDGGSYTQPTSTTKKKGIFLSELIWGGTAIGILIGLGLFGQYIDNLPSDKPPQPKQVVRINPNIPTITFDNSRRTPKTTRKTKTPKPNENLRSAPTIPYSKEPMSASEYLQYKREISDIKEQLDYKKRYLKNSLEASLALNPEARPSSIGISQEIEQQYQENLTILKKEIPWKRLSKSQREGLEKILK